MTDNSNQYDNQNDDHFYFDDTSFIFEKNKEAEQINRRIKRINLAVVLASILFCSIFGYIIAVTLP